MAFSFSHLSLLVAMAMAMAMVLLTVTECSNWRKEIFPNPGTDAGSLICLQKQKSSVCDPDNVLNTTQRERLAELVNSTWLSTPCFCRTPCLYSRPRSRNESANENANATYHDGFGLQIGVAIMENLSLLTGNTKRTELLDFAIFLRDEGWTLGTPGCGNSVIVALATAAGRIDIAVGRESFARGLTGNCAAFLAKDATDKYFKFKKWYEGLVYINTKLKLFYQKIGQCEKEYTDQGVGIFNTIILVVVVLVGLSITFFFASRAGCFKCGARSNEHDYYQSSDDDVELSGFGDGDDDGGDGGGADF